MSLGIRPLVGGSHLLNALGVNSGVIQDQLQKIQQRVQLLNQLGGGFGAQAQLSPSNLAGLIQQGSIPGAGTMPPPNMGACGCPHRFANTREIDLGASQPSLGHQGQLMARQQGAMLEQFLRTNPFARQQLEMALGGKVVGDGVIDGKIRLRPFTVQPTLGGTNNLAAQNAAGALDQINRGALAGGPALGGQSPYQTMIANGFANALSGKGGMGSPFAELMATQGLSPAQIIGGPGGIPNAGQGLLPGIENPIGLPNLAGGPAQGAPALGGAQGLGGAPALGAAQGLGGAPGLGGAADLNNIMGNANLSVEDKVTLLLMQLMKKADKEIEQQANQLQRLQAQQNGQGAGGQGGATPSIDVESMKLKRLVDKRNQMFDTLRSMVDKYNQTAKGMIDGIGR